MLQKHDVTVVDPPADYPDYGEGYYAVFFLDPDGLKLEGMVFKPPRKKKQRRRRLAISEGVNGGRRWVSDPECLTPP